MRIDAQPTENRSSWTAKLAINREFSPKFLR
jgi:hypothetical protein